MSKLTVVIVLLISMALFLAVASVGLAVNNAMEAAGAKCERSTLSFKCKLEW